MFFAFAGFWMYAVHLPLLLLVISLVYSATRYDPPGAIVLESLRWIRNMVFFLGVIGALLYGLAILI